ncbi:hypothetical protein SAMN05444338_11420 [Flavobacterium degerlachei]|uniref:Uncharacterized protein n=1 Tax=Flavobacterium degerlachei TaxID=229203 RepID=A0A1H3E3N0_9FLAO|nr:hypothetical protein SAMN05444338_11420 [Flavobacterium degerlachei]
MITSKHYISPINGDYAPTKKLTRPIKGKCFIIYTLFYFIHGNHKVKNYKLILKDKVHERENMEVDVKNYNFILFSGYNFNSSISLLILLSVRSLI